AQDGLYRLYSDGRRRRLTPEIDGSFQYLPRGSFTARAGVARPEYSDSGLFAVSGEAGTRLILADLRDGHEGDVVEIESPGDGAAPLASSIDARAALFLARDGSASRLLLARAGKPPRELARINAHLNGVELGEWRIVSYRLGHPDGAPPPREVESCVLLPPGYEPGKRYPLIIEVYPGARATCEPGPASAPPLPDATSPYLFAARGYIYSGITLPRDLIATQDGPISGMDEAVEQSVDALVRAGYADPSRTVLFGTSQGGASALYVAAQSHSFRAVISGHGWADNFSHYFSGHGVYGALYGEETPFGNMTRYESEAGADFGVGRTLFEDPDLYVRTSPVFLARGVSCPVMLIHSDMDGFPIEQYDEMFAALYRLGKEARYVRYWGEGHAISSPANMRDLWERLDLFLAEALASSSDSMKAYRQDQVP
ncbi:MAG: S9 family peptidase, partial [Oricola sp.]|nr:S9 family peptidase [Oricola sp.]